MEISAKITVKFGYLTVWSYFCNAVAYPDKLFQVTFLSGSLIIYDKILNVRDSDESAAF